MVTEIGGREGDTALSRKILIVEDDASTSAYLAKGLAEAGHAIEACADGRDGLFLASEGIFELIIADRMLPGLDGLSMVSAIRAAGIATPVLILSALAAVDDRVVGRYTCAKCCTGYHDRYKKPVVAGVCDVCGSTEFKRRPDDNAETVHNRMAEYRAKTAPILPIYDARGLVHRVDGMADIAHVGSAIAAILDKK